MLQKNVNLEFKTILVTGAVGFIGSYLCKRLLQEVQGVRIIGVDSITDYYDVNIKNNRPHISINLSVDADIMTLEKDVNYQSEETLQKVSSSTQDYLKNQINKFRLRG